MLGFGKKVPTTNEASIILKQYENVKAYKSSMGFENDWKKYIDFVEDKQWTHTQANKNMPKPQHNIIKFAKRSKTSAILSDVIKISFSPLENVENDIANEASEMFNDAAEQTLEEIEQDRLDYEVVSDAFTLGTGFIHYTWDNKAHGGYKTKYIGKMQGETLDSMNVFPGNPQQKDSNKQPFWIVTYRDMVVSIKKKAADNKVPPELIALIMGDKDKGNYDADNIEVLGEDKTTVYTKYERSLEDGKIYFSKCTKGVLFQPKEALWDYQGTEEEPYPIAYFAWEDRKKSLFGIGEVEGMIYNQKAINFISAMQIMNVQDTGWSKYVEKNNALNGALITNKPGEIIKDVSGIAGDNIKAMQPATMSPQCGQVLEDTISNTRIFNGVSESVTGENIGANVAAASIIAAQNQQKIPLDAIKNKFHRYRKDTGKIMEFFFKCKFNTPRMIKHTEEQQAIPQEELLQGQMQGLQPQQQIQPLKETSIAFTGTDYNEVPLNLKIDVGVGSSSSEALATATLDRFLDKGWITPLQYADLVSDNVMPFKEKFKKMKLEEEQNQLVQATKALQQNQNTIQKLQMQLQQGQMIQQTQTPIQPQQIQGGM